MLPLLGTPLHDDHDLPFWLMLPVPSGDFSKGPPPMLLMDLGNLPRHRASTLRSEKLRELVQSLHKPVRRLVENHGPGLSGQLRQQSLPPLLHREKAFEAEAITRKSR